MPVRSRRRMLGGSLAVAGLGVLSGCGLASFPGTRQAGPRRIGFIDSLPNQTTFVPFREGMRDLGYVDGENVAIEYRTADGDLERLPALVADLVAFPVEILLAPNPIVARAAREATQPSRSSRRAAMLSRLDWSPTLPTPRGTSRA